MAAIKMMLGRIRNLVPKSSKQARDLVRSTTEVADQIIHEVRTISHLMPPPLLDEGGLHPAVHWYARGFSERSGIAANLQMDEGFGRLPRGTEIAVFRSVQEALTNVHRHSGSRDAIIQVVRSGLKDLLEEQPGVEACCEAKTGVEAVENVKKTKPDMVLVELTMPDMNGLDAARQIREVSPNTDVLVVSMHYTEEIAR